MSAISRMALMNKRQVAWINGLKTAYVTTEDIFDVPTIDAVPVVHYKDTNTTVLNVKSIEDWQDRIILDEGEESRSSAVYYADSDDMVRVVRCKDCKHWGTTDYAIAETEHVKCCAYANYMIDANGYCMYGEIKEATK